MLASPGFMQIGPSRELFELWAPDSRNGLIITGYSIEGTLARVSGSGLSFESVYLRRALFLYIHALMDMCFPFLDAIPQRY